MFNHFSSNFLHNVVLIFFLFEKQLFILFPKISFVVSSRIRKSFTFSTENTVSSATSSVIYRSSNFFYLYSIPFILFFYGLFNIRIEQNRDITWPFLNAHLFSLLERAHIPCGCCARIFNNKLYQFTLSVAGKAGSYRYLKAYFLLIPGVSPTHAFAMTTRVVN